MSMTMGVLENEITVMLNALKTNYKKDRLIKNVSVQFLVEDFGTIVCGINRADYKIVDDQIKQSYPGWRAVYITTFDRMFEKKEEVIWALMCGGYMAWIRAVYPRAFSELIIVQEFGKKIINQRLKIWENKPKYKFLIDEHEYAKQQSATYVLSIEPGFYDMMPEIKKEENNEED